LRTQVAILLLFVLVLPACGGGSTSGGGGAADLSANGNLGPASSNPNVITQTSRRYYDVFGNSRSELQQQLQNNGPGPYYGGVTSTISYEYTAQGNCAIAGARAMVISELTLPRWSMPAGTSVELANEWNRFVAALEVHELNHVRIDIRQAEIFLASVFNLPGHASCTELDAAIGLLHQQALQRAMVNNTAYDQQTQHGGTEGAIL